MMMAGWDRLLTLIDGKGTDVLVNGESLRLAKVIAVARSERPSRIFFSASPWWLVLDCNVSTTSRSTVFDVCFLYAHCNVSSSSPTIECPTLFDRPCRPQQSDIRARLNTKAILRATCQYCLFSRHDILSRKKYTDFGEDHRYGAFANPSGDINPRVRASSEYLTRCLAHGDCVYGKFAWTGNSVCMH